jgi:small GTP-binding protein
MASDDIKIAFVGNGAVGKTALARRWLTDCFAEGRHETIGFNFHAKSAVVRGREYRVSLVDAAGQQLRSATARSTFQLYIKDCDLVFLCFDPGERDALPPLEQWYGELAQVPLRSLFLVATKRDLRSAAGAEWPDALPPPRALAQRFRAEGAFDTSALTGAGVRELFAAALEFHVANPDRPSARPGAVDIGAAAERPACCA